MNKGLVKALQNVLAGFTPDTEDREELKKLLKEAMNEVQ